MYDTPTDPLPSGFVIPNGSWGRHDDWTPYSDNTPEQETRDPPLTRLYWPEEAI